jgi:16S rRNA (cytosine1402-N4)-methyltransferase
MSAAHIPVLRDEVIEALAPRVGGVYLDATFGRGGYSRALLAKNGTQVIGLDRDEAAVAEGKKLAAENPRFTMLKGAFGDLDHHLAEAKVTGVDGIAFDIGVSSPQLDEAERGFSFSKDGPLDMRMDQTQGKSAADLVNTLKESDLADLIYKYGEERQSRRIAKAIVENRPLTRTTQLANAIRSVIRRKPNDIDPATRTFQALRIAVNDELGELERGLAAAEKMLKPGGRLAVVSFHSLEDRIVKNFMRDAAGRVPAPSRHLPDAAPQTVRLTLVGKQPITPGDAECARNPRARSARLRVAERISEGGPLS